MDNEKLVKDEINKLFDNTNKNKYQYINQEQNTQEVLYNNFFDKQQDDNNTILQKTLVKDKIDTSSKQVIQNLLNKCKIIKEKNEFNNLKIDKYYNNNQQKLFNIVQANTQYQQRQQPFNNRPTNKKNDTWQRVILLAKELYIPFAIVKGYEELKEKELQEKEIELNISKKERDNLIGKITPIANQLGIDISFFSTMTVEKLKIFEQELLEVLSTRQIEKEKQQQKDNIEMNNIDNNKTTKNIEQNNISNNINPQIRINVSDKDNVEVMTKNAESNRSTQKLLNHNIQIDIKPEPKSLYTTMIKNQDSIETKVKSRDEILNKEKDLTKTAVETETIEKNLSQTLTETTTRTLTETVVETMTDTTNRTENIVKNLLYSKDKTDTKVENKNLTTNDDVDIKKKNLLTGLYEKDRDCDVWVVSPALADRTTRSWDENHNCALNLLYERLKPIGKLKLLDILPFKTPIDDIPFWPNKMVDKDHGEFIIYKGCTSRDGKIIPVYGIIEMNFNMPELMKTAEIFKKAKKICKKTHENPDNIMLQHTCHSVITDVIDKPKNETVVVNKLYIQEKEKDKNISKDNNNEKVKNSEKNLKLNTNIPKQKSFLATISKSSNTQQHTQNISQQREKNKRNNDYSINAKALYKLQTQKNNQFKQKTLFNIQQTNQNIDNNRKIKSRIFNKKNTKILFF